MNAWNSNVALNVVLNGGVLQGGAITVANANGIKGQGLVSLCVINNTRLEANVAASTLVFETAANDNDWDGAGNIGLLAASNGGTLEIRDNATFTYGGTVTATVPQQSVRQRIRSQLRHNFRDQPYRVDTANRRNLRFQRTHQRSGRRRFNHQRAGKPLPDDPLDEHRLARQQFEARDKQRRDPGPALPLAGACAIIVPVGSHLITDSVANINALLDIEGTLRPSGFNTVGNETIKDYQQASTGLVEFELTGTLLNQFDRLTVTDVAQLGGSLNIDIDGAFVPALGNTFNIISAPGGVSGTFSNIDVSGMPAGLTFHVNYTATTVQLQVVNKALFSADFDDDGDVDSTDYAIWRHAFGLNQLGDANGDNLTDARDYVLWRKQLGSHSGDRFRRCSAAAVPEPGTAVLMFVAALACVPARGRK